MERFSARKFIVANAAIILLATAAYSLIFRCGSFFLGLLAFPILLLISLFPQTLLPARYRSNRRVRGLAFLLPAVAIALLLVVPSAIASIHAVKVGRILRTARLAPLPESASDVRVASWAAGFGFGAYLRFDAPREDVESFLESSPGLEGLSPQGAADRDLVSGYDVPDWFDPQADATRYRLDRKGDSPYGALIVSRSRNRVYICLYD